MNINLEISHNNLLDALSDLSYQNLMDLIQGIDLAKADCGFTEDLVRLLVKSLKADKDDVNLPFIDWEKV